MTSDRITPHKNRVYVLVTVDWEADHGPWHSAPSLEDEDYGGVLVGTDGLIQLLDEFGIPCTWLVECHMEKEARDLPRLFPDEIIRLSQRAQDELGVHIHWTRSENGQDVYPLSDTPWIEAQVKHATQTLTALIDKAPRSFRGGAFLSVPHLPRILENHQYEVDSTWIERNPLRRFFGLPAQPYYCDYSTTRSPSSSRIVEFPTHFRVTTPSTLWAIDRLIAYHIRALAHQPTSTFLTLYLHIDELAMRSSGRNEKAELDPRMMAAISRLFQRLSKSPAVSFVTMASARQAFERQCSKEEVSIA